jgi:hypothetical protein
MNMQSELFETTSSSPLIGMMVQLDRSIDQLKPCCSNMAIVTIDKGQHAAGLVCASCGRHRGWISKSTTTNLQAIIDQWGVPTKPLVVRDSSRCFEGC